MKALSSPLVVILLAVLLSAAPMLHLVWKHGQIIVTAAAARRAAEVEAARPAKPWDFWTPEVENLAKDLTAERAKIAVREAEVAAREKRLVDEARELDQIRSQLARMRDEIDSRLVEVKEQELRNLKSLATTYSRLTPTAAVAIFNQLDDLTVAKLLSLMKPEIISAILEELSRTPGPDNANVKRAAELSMRLRLLIPTQKTGA